MSGLLSQALQNLIAATQQIAALSGLPPQAQQLQAATGVAIKPLPGLIQNMQQTGSAFVARAVPELNDIMAMLTNNQPIVDIKAKMSAVLDQTASLDNVVMAVTKQAESISSLIFGDFNQLAIIEAGLSGQATNLQGQLGAAQGEEAAAQKRYYYLIALGPFGLIGLAAALALYLKLKSDVNDIQSSISNLNAQINVLTAMQSACNALGTDFQSVIARTSDVRNAMDLLGGSIQQINNDLNNGSDRITMEIVVRATITEITALGIDLG